MCCSYSLAAAADDGEGDHSVPLHGRSAGHRGSRHRICTSSIFQEKRNTVQVRLKSEEGSV